MKIETGKDFERECVLAVSKAESVHMSRNGVRVSIAKDGEMIRSKSLPDFSGAIAPIGREFVFDAKKTNSASFPLNNYRESKSKAKQLKHLLDRSRVGSITFFLIHWNERRLKTKTVEAATIAFPVHFDMSFWIAFDMGEQKSISLDECKHFGIDVEWETPARCRRPRMNLIAAMKEMAEWPLFDCSGSGGISSSLD